MRASIPRRRTGASGPRQLLEDMADAIIRLDRNSIVVGWNTGAERLFGYTAEEVLGNFPPLVPLDDQSGDGGHVGTRARQRREFHADREPAAPQGWALARYARLALAVARRGRDRRRHRRHARHHRPQGTGKRTGAARRGGRAARAGHGFCRGGGPGVQLGRRWPGDAANARGPGGAVGGFRLGRHIRGRAKPGLPPMHPRRPRRTSRSAASSRRGRRSSRRTSSRRASPPKRRPASSTYASPCSRCRSMAAARGRGYHTLASLPIRAVGEIVGVLSVVARGETRARYAVGRDPRTRRGAGRARDRAGATEPASRRAD